jgi:hypothetical protein
VIRYLTIRKFAAESGYTEDAIRSKIRDGIWREGHEWKRAPDDRVLIDVDGYHRWVESGAMLAVHRKPTKASSAAPLTPRRKPGSSGSPPPLT